MILDTCHLGDCRELMAEWPEQSVQCVVTSPPYWGLRDYGVAGQIGLEQTISEYVAKIVRLMRQVRRVLAVDGTLWLNMGDSYHTPRWGGSVGVNSTINGQRTQEAYRDAQKAQRDRAGRGHPKRADREHAHSELAYVGPGVQANRGRSKPGLKPKDLVGMPWRIAFALQADGWWLRSDIIWHKPNPMPESITDRPTKTHEYLFLLSKSERYYYDADAIKEPASLDSHARYARGRSDDHKYADSDQTIARGFEHMRPAGVNPKATLSNGVGWGYADQEPKERTRKFPSGWKDGPGAHETLEHATKADVADERVRDGRKFGREPGWRNNNRQNESFSAAVADTVESRNKRTVWTIPTQPYKGAHFATFPEALVEPCILAGSRPGDVVCDPFMGSGTVARVAQNLGRKWIGCELNPAYVALQADRTRERGLTL